MHTPRIFREDDTEALLALARQHPLGTLITASAAGLIVDHLPFSFDAGGDGLRLQAHVPRGNPLVAALAEPVECIVVFQGADGYITPSWYATKREDGKVVPTWNYAVVHAHGVAHCIDDAGWVRRQIDALTDQQEHTREQPWAVTDAPADYTERLVRALVGIEVRVARLEGKVKASQNQPAANKASLADALAAEAPGSALEQLMRPHVGTKR